MDNGEKERAVMNSLKDIVKQTSRRKSSVPYYNNHHSTTRIAAKPSDGPVVKSFAGLESNRQHGVTPSLYHGWSQEDEANMAEDGSTVRTLVLSRDWKILTPTRLIHHQVVAII